MSTKRLKKGNLWGIRLIEARGPTEWALSCSKLLLIGLVIPSILMTSKTDKGLINIKILTLEEVRVAMWIRTKWIKKKHSLICNRWSIMKAFIMMRNLLRCSPMKRTSNIRVLMKIELVRDQLKMHNNINSPLWQQPPGLNNKRVQGDWFRSVVVKTILCT